MSDTDATAARLRPDVVLMGIRMPVLDGIAATRQIHQAHTTGNVIILTTIDLDQYVYDALEAVASGFLLRTSRRRWLQTPSAPSTLAMPCWHPRSRGDSSSAPCLNARS